MFCRIYPTIIPEVLTEIQYQGEIHQVVRYFQHAHFIPIVGVKREWHINWSMVMQRQHPLLELP